ncbi:hypothetical protein [Pyruvatibacter sp.]|uniref:hypothetical protein n=1 Tax=Pyruvatibacter sp. TaxID=1981328 RepID=UPI0032EF5CD9
MSTLLIGTTGMLAPASRAIAAQQPGDIVVMSRRAGGFSFADAALDARVRPCKTDWKDAAAFLAALDQAAEAHGPFTAALVWLHGRDELLRARIVHHMAAGGRLVEVLGSAASRPGAFGDVRLQQMQRLTHVTYRQVLLGFMRDGDHSRWLTNDEISASAIEAFTSDDVVTIAGQVEPWDMRP